MVIHFDNKDSVPHNVDVTTDEGGSNTVFKEDPFSGPKAVDYKFSTPVPGKYGRPSRGIMPYSCSEMVSTWSLS